MSPKALRNTVAQALIAELHAKNLPQTMAERARRRVLMAQAISRVHGVDFARVYAVVNTVWPLVMEYHISRSRV